MVHSAHSEISKKWMTMKFKSLKKLAIGGALLSSLTCTSNANTITNSVEEANVPAGTVKDIALANNQLLITSDDAAIGGVPVKLFSTDTNNLHAAFGAGDTNQLLFTNNISSLTYDPHSTNAWYGLEGTHDNYILGNMDVRKKALSSVSHRNFAEITSDGFYDFPSPILNAIDGHIWLSFIDPDTNAVCVTKYQIDGNTNLVETANSYFDGREFSKIHSSATDGSKIWCTVTDKNGQDSILYLQEEPLNIEEETNEEEEYHYQGEQGDIKSSCGVALLGGKAYAVSSDQKKLSQFELDKAFRSDVVDFGEDKISAITSDGQHIFAASESGDKIYKVSPEHSVQTIVLDRHKTTPIKKIIAHNGTLYGATSRSVLKTRSE